MIAQFDELTKSMAQSVTRRAAFKRFGLGLAGMVLAGLGLPYKTSAAPRNATYCQVSGAWFTTQVWFTGLCMDVNTCVSYASAQCPASGTPAGSVPSGRGTKGDKLQSACFYLYRRDMACS